VAATTATVFPVPEDELSAEDLAALAAIEQAYANRQHYLSQHWGVVTGNAGLPCLGCSEKFL
jgi:hypothetical protein